jgi:hypothetical protein
MATRRSLIRIDMQQVLRSADLFARIDGTRLGVAALDAVNEVAPRAERRARGNIVEGVNLGDGYVRARMGVRLATDPGNPEAVVYALASGRGDRRTPLGRYDPKQLTTAAKRPKRAKGDKSRGIPAGQKGAGVSVEVLRGSRESMPGGFVMPLRAGKAAAGNGVGVFTRSRDGKVVKHRLGPSVYQLFTVQRERIFDESASELQLLVLQEADRIVEDLRK